MAKTNIFGHNSSDGTSFSKRIERRCGASYGSSGENIGTDFKVEGRDHALKTVMGLIIDDGVPSRGHRKNIFSKDFKHIGISSRVQQDKIITVMDFHSNELGLKKPGSQVSDAGNKLQYEQKHQGGGFGGGHGFKAEDWGGAKGGWEISTAGNGGGRYVVSKSTNTKTQQFRWHLLLQAHRKEVWGILRFFRGKHRNCCV